MKELFYVWLVGLFKPTWGQGTVSSANMYKYYASGCCQWVESTNINEHKMPYRRRSQDMDITQDMVLTNIWTNIIKPDKDKGQQITIKSVLVKNFAKG